MAPVQSIKVEFNGELRRFVCPPTMNFADLNARVCGLFSLAADDKERDAPVLSYRDEDGDLVRISNDDELGLALRLHAEGVIVGATLRLYVSQRGMLLPTAPTTATAPPLAGDDTMLASTAADGIEAAVARPGLPRGPAGGGKKKCMNQAKARFVKDVTIDKGQVIEPGAAFTKIWRFRNEGIAAWARGTQLSLLPKNSDNLGGPSVLPLDATDEVTPGKEIDVAIDLVAPTQPGRYVAYYRLYDPARDKRFGQRVWVEILVVSSSSSDGDEWQLLAESGGKPQPKKARRGKKAKVSASSSEEDDNDNNNNNDPAASGSGKHGKAKTGKSAKKSVPLAGKLAGEDDLA